MMVAVLAFGVAAWGVVGAQDATEEPTAEATAETGTTTEAIPAPDMTAEAQPSAPDRPFLGVLLQETADGVTVAEVREGSPAADAGLQAGDIITAVNGTDVASNSEVAAAIGELAVGDDVTLDITRNGDAQTITATLGAAPLETPSPVPPQGPRGDREGRGGRALGLEYNAEDQSWTITRLSEDSPLYAVGLRENDVITGIDGSTYDLPALAEYLNSLDADATVTLNVTRDGATQDIQIAASDLKGLFGPGMGFGGILRDGMGRNGNLPNMPDGFMDMLPMFQMAYGNGRLGLSFQTIDEQVAADNSLSVTDGALVQAVDEGSAAAEAGIQAGDVITAVNGEPVDAERTLRDRMIAYEAGDTVTLSILRDGETMDVQATLTEPEMGDFNGMFPNMMPFDFGGGSDNAAPTAEATPQANA
jgi:S1-C subfamily serine protease